MQTCPVDNWACIYTFIEYYYSISKTVHKDISENFEYTQQLLGPEVEHKLLVKFWKQ